jgi:hypothetical protein
MKIELHEITIRDVAKGYVDNYEDGVLGFEILNPTPPSPH